MIRNNLMLRFQFRSGGCSHGVRVKALVCEIIGNEFESQSDYYVHLRAKYPWERHEALIFLTMG